MSTMNSRLGCARICAGAALVSVLGITASAQTLPSTLPNSMPILAGTNGTFSGDATISGSSTVILGAFDYFLVGGGGGGGNAPGSDGAANGGNGGARVSGTFSLGEQSSLAVTVGGGGAIQGQNRAGRPGGATSIAGVGTANGGDGGSSTGGSAVGAAGSTVQSITGNTYRYGGGGGDGRIGSIQRYGGGASGGGYGGYVGNNSSNFGSSSAGAGNSGGGGGGGADNESRHVDPSRGGSGRAFIHYYGTADATTGGTAAFENTVNDGTDTTRYWNGGGTLGLATNAADQESIFVGMISGGTLIKDGPGTLVLAGDNTYTGTTTIAAGTLRVNNTNGSGTGTGAVQVIGGTLGGTGTIGGLVTVNSGGYLAPGTSAGTLTLTNGLTLVDGAELNFDELPGDRIKITGGTFTGAGTNGVTVNVTSSGPPVLDVLVLMDWTDSAESGVEESDFVLALDPPWPTNPRLAVWNQKLLLLPTVPFTMLMIR